MKINDKGIKKIYRSLALSLGGLALALPASARADSHTPPVFFGSRANYSRQISSAALPVPLPGSKWHNAGGPFTIAQENKMVVIQSEENAVAEWRSFDVGKEAWVHFDQQGNTDWKILNRIYDANPSQIFGKMTADGAVYLINQNGILFGEGSSVNVHSLVSSALDINTGDFLNQQQNSTLSFTMRNYNGQEEWDPDQVFIRNEGEISVELIQGEEGKETVIRNGSVFFLAPHVENYGAIVAPYGQIGLAAGQEVEIRPETSSEYSNEKRVQVVAEPGYAVNREEGGIVADNGRAGLYGSIVNQDGLIRTVTSVYHRGRIELRASDRISTGPQSQTLAPVTSSDERTNVTFTHRPGQILLAGLDAAKDDITYTTEIEHRGLISALSGAVIMRATDNITLDGNATVDVAGMWSDRSADALWFSQEMNSAQLKDDHLQKNGLFYRSQVTVNELLGSAIGDFNDTYKSAEMTSREKASEGGKVSLRALDGHIDIRDGALIDVSGGGHINEGSSNLATKVVYGTRVIDISAADPDMVYEKFADFFEKKHERYGVVDEYEGLYYGGVLPLYDTLGAHVEGHDAGCLELVSRSFNFNGSFFAGVEIGPYQIYDDYLFAEDGIYEKDGKEVTEKQRRPAAGSLIIGNQATGNVYENYINFVNEVVISHRREDDLDVEAGQYPPDPEGTPFYRASLLPDEVINASGLGTLSIATNYRIAVDREAGLELDPGAKINFVSRRIEHEGGIDIPSGRVSFAVVDNSTAYEQNYQNYLDFDEYIFLGENSHINVAGERVDSRETITSGKLPESRVLSAGGSITLTDLTDEKHEASQIYDITHLTQGKGVIVAKNAVLDVSGGYEITAAGEVEPGDGGEIFISGSNVVLAGTLKGHCLPGAEGATLAVYGNNIDLLSGKSASQSLGAMLAGKVTDLVAREVLVKLPIDPDFIGALRNTLALLETIAAGLDEEKYKTDIEAIESAARNLTEQLAAYDPADREGIYSAKSNIIKAVNKLYAVLEKVPDGEIADTLSSIMLSYEVDLAAADGEWTLPEDGAYLATVESATAELSSSLKAGISEDALQALGAFIEAYELDDEQGVNGFLARAMLYLYERREEDDVAAPYQTLATYLAGDEGELPSLSDPLTSAWPTDKEKLKILLLKRDFDALYEDKRFQGPLQALLAMLAEYNIDPALLGDFDHEQFDLPENFAVSAAVDSILLSKGIISEVGFETYLKFLDELEELYSSFASDYAYLGRVANLKKILTSYGVEIPRTEDGMDVDLADLPTQRYELEDYLRENEIDLPSFNRENSLVNYLIPEEQLAKGLILNTDTLKESGFGHFSFNGVYDLVIAEGVDLAPSLTRISPPNPAEQVLDPLYDEDYFEEEEFLVGDTSLSLAAGAKLVHSGIFSEDDRKFIITYFKKLGEGSQAASGFDTEFEYRNQTSRFMLPENSSLAVPPGGAVSVKAPDLLVAGTIKAPAGSIELVSASSQPSDLIVGGSARVLAPGYNVPALEKEIDWLDLTYTPLAGGAITLANETGGLLALEEGALLDVSGSRPVVTGYYVEENESGFNKAATENPFQALIGAGAAGSVSLSFKGSSTLEGTIAAKSYLPGLDNGSLTIFSKKQTTGFAVTDEILGYFRDNDFDYWTLGSWHSLIFSRNLTIGHQGRLTLDAPLLVSDNGAQSQISAHYLQLRNSYYPFAGLSGLDLESEEGEVPANGGFTFQADYLDIQGAISFDGAETVSLSSNGDIILHDLYYHRTNDDPVFIAGWLATAGDLELKAARIYPSSQSDFTIYAADTLTILPGGESDKIMYSAAGSLHLLANRIDHRGYLAAPLGSLTLSGVNVDTLQDMDFMDSLVVHDEESRQFDDAAANAFFQDLVAATLSSEENSRVMVGSDSTLTVRGPDYLIDYGDIDEKGVFWTVSPGTGNAGVDNSPAGLQDVESAPFKTLKLEGDEVLVREGADIDLAGGGGIFAHRFLRGIEGTKNPLHGDNQYLLAPNLELPGKTVTMVGGAAVEPGTYTLLALGADHPQNDKYAFLPGALVLIDHGEKYSFSEEYTTEGYPLVRGLFGQSGRETREQVPSGFAVRSAEEVLSEGYFAVKQEVGGDGGSFTLSGRESLVTSILEADINAHPLEGYTGGAFDIAARYVEVGSDNTTLADDFSIDDTMPEELRNKLIVKDTTFSGNGFEDIFIGDIAITRTVTFKENTRVKGRNITVAASSGYDSRQLPVAEMAEAEVAALIEEMGITDPAELPEFIEANEETRGRIAMEDNAVVEALANEDEEVVTSLAFLVDSEGGFAADDGHQFTPASLELAETSLMRSNTVSLESCDMVLGGNNIEADYSLNLKTQRIIFSDERGEESGLYLSGGQWADFSAIREITLDSATDIIFTTDYALSADHNVTLDAQRIGGYGVKDQTSLAAGHLTLRNSKYSSTSSQWLSGVTELDGQGTLALMGRESMVLGPGVVRVAGFGETSLATNGDLALCGKARLYYQEDLEEDVWGPSIFAVSGDLSLAAARLTLIPDYDLSSDTYKVADFQLQAEGRLTIGSAPVSVAGETTNLGGHLAVEAEELAIAGLIDTRSAEIELAADKVEISGEIRSLGTDSSAGGSVSVKAGEAFSMAGGTVDVSAGEQGDAGSIMISAPTAASFFLTTAAPIVQEVAEEGVQSSDRSAQVEDGQDGSPGPTRLLAAAQGGRGGSLELDVANLSGEGGAMALDEVNGLLGDFSEGINIRTRKGNLNVGRESLVSANEVKLSADGGAINIYGKLDSTGSTAGRIELNSTDDLNLYDGSLLSAVNEVKLHSAGGWINFGREVEGEADPARAAIVLSGADAELRFRTLRTASENGVQLNVDGDVSGAKRVDVEAVRVYENTSNINVVTENTGKRVKGKTTEVLPDTGDDYFLDTETFMTAYEDKIRELFADLGLADGQLHVLPGIEIQSDNDLTITGGWDLYHKSYLPADDTYTLWRFGANDEPVALTLRAAKNLVINGAIYDMPTPDYGEYDTTKVDPRKVKTYGNYEDDISEISADITLIAGADLGSADVLTVSGDDAYSGNLVLGGEMDNAGNWQPAYVYSETGDIDFASGGDTLIASNTDFKNDSRTTVLVKEKMPTPWYEGSLAFNLASYRGDISGQVAGDLTVLGSVQSAAGDIDIEVGGNLALNFSRQQYNDLADRLDVDLTELAESDYSGLFARLKLSYNKEGSSQPVGAIRTTGLPAWFGYELIDASTGTKPNWIVGSAGSKNYYDYNRGGAISISVGEKITGGITLNGPEQLKMGDSYVATIESGWNMWWADEQKTGAAYVYNQSANAALQSTLGLATMAGGDITVKAGGDIWGQIGSFSEGDLSVSSGADINGRFLGASGKVDINAMGNFGTGYRESDSIVENQQIELGSSSLRMRAEGAIDLGALLSPSSNKQISFTEQTSATLTAGFGNVRFTSRSFLEDMVTDSKYRPDLLPPSLFIEAGNDIVFDSNFSMMMTPAKTGQLELTAGRDIIGKQSESSAFRKVVKLYMMQQDPTVYYGNLPGSSMPDEPLHSDDPQPIRITAGRDLKNLRFALPKQAEIRAGRDLTDIELLGQNNNPKDITLIEAGRNIELGSYERTEEEAQKAGFTLAGPGALLVLAGNDIDLGTTWGIRTIANGQETGKGGSDIWKGMLVGHPGLAYEGADIYVAAGLDHELKTAEADGFFVALRKYGKYFSLIAAEKTIEGADQAVSEQAGKDIKAVLAEMLKNGDDDALLAMLAALDSDMVPAELESMMAADGEDFDLFVDNLLAVALELKETGQVALAGIVDITDTYRKVISAMADASTTGAAAKAVEYLAREEAVGPMLGEELPTLPEDGGNIIMAQSQIATKYGGDVNIIAAGAMDVGFSFFAPEDDGSAQASTICSLTSSGGKESSFSPGIRTEFGGDINIYSVGDVNVNESRVMTWMGGDMTMWSEANINAGRGSKTAVNASGNNFTRQNEEGIYEIFKKPSAPGSGIRALTFDMDGRGGPREMPEPGDIYLFAPSGIIDAGEAGIVGGTIYLAATEVLNAQNITFTTGGVGVPLAADTSLSLGAISGAGNIAAAAGEVTKNVSGLDEAGQKALEQMASLTEDLKPRWVEVEVLDLMDDEEKQ